MKTMDELKDAINYRQTDEHFLAYLALLEKHGVISIADSDIDTTARTVSSDFFRRLAAVYGVPLDSELNPVRTEA
nr:hypothetical protein [Klebsiella variicola]